MTPVRRSLAALALASLPVLALAQSAPATAPSDGRLRYALGGGATLLSGTTSAAAVNLGGEGVVATTESRWRFGSKALWSRTVGETAAENMTLQLVQESQHRWSHGLWFRQRVSMEPALRPRDGLRSSFETGLALVMSPLLSFNLGVTQRYDGNAAVKRSDPLFATAIALKLP